MGLFSKISEAKVSEGGNYLTAGVYRLEITKVITKLLRSNKHAFIVEFRVMESDNPKHRVGADVTWMVTFDKEPALGNIKQFIATACGSTDLDAVDEATAELVCVEEGENAQPLKGKFVRASAVDILTRRNTPFTRVKFILDSEGSANAAAAHVKHAA